LQFFLCASARKIINRPVHCFGRDKNFFASLRLCAKKINFPVHRTWLEGNAIPLRLRVIKKFHNFQKRGFARKKINFPVHCGGREITAIPLRLSSEGGLRWEQV
jgi:hypothetical protein